MEFKGTKGNWKFEETEKVESNLDIALMSEPYVLGWLYSDGFSQGKDELIANAKLIAAAPILLKELQKIKLDIDLGTIRVNKDSPIYKGLEQAINKALKS